MLTETKAVSDAQAVDECEAAVLVLVLGLERPDMEGAALGVGTRHFSSRMTWLLESATYTVSSFAMARESGFEKSAAVPKPSA